MQIKTIAPIPVLYFTTETTFKELANYVYVIAKQLYGEAVKQDFLPVSAVQWLYHDCSGKPDEPFTLDIALPVSSAPATPSSFQFKELPAFKCISSIYEGSYDKMSIKYEEVFSWAKANGYETKNEFREVYWDMAKGKEITEIQIGLR